jgi:hypothetical protein
MTYLSNLNSTYKPILYQKIIMHPPLIYAIPQLPCNTAKLHCCGQTTMS